MLDLARVPAFAAPSLALNIRARIEATLERLIALLDLLDAPDADMEPSLGFDMPGVPCDAEAAKAVPSR